MPENRYFPENNLRESTEWEIEPKCECGFVKSGFEAGTLFTSDYLRSGFNICYCYMVPREGSPSNKIRTPIDYCPWCGERIKVKKKDRLWQATD
jgi:hypothetical protein